MEKSVAYLDCETCLRLWAEYGVAAKLKQETGAPDIAGKVENILRQIEIHEAEVHPPGTDI
jgi:hypothetical protein